jgi:hypothetical protein
MRRNAVISLAPSAPNRSAIAMSAVQPDEWRKALLVHGQRSAWSELIAP